MSDSISAGDRTSRLEAKLAEVSAATNAIAQSFANLYEDIKKENVGLKDEVDTLVDDVEQRENRIWELRKENREYRATVEKLSRKMKILTGVLGAMEEQRHQVLKVTGQWEDALLTADENCL
uniref:Uncharacterized protein n=1 Tax=Ditylum brightwellii TaxID=49249 RepID=A0A6U3UZ08_9STRA|mmetsp:Transcript_717/g.1159  ORF Transcript_717/g.1159 Transcript_717/m.1159 type:complete len:122 (-) Transcript_717:123-488(-)